MKSEHGENYTSPNRRLTIARGLEGYDQRKALTGLIVSLYTGENRFHKNRDKLLIKARSLFDNLTSKP